MKGKHASQRRISTAFMMLWAASGLAFGQPTALNRSQLPAEGAAPADFIPKGWREEQRAAGDLNRDGKADIAAVLVRQTPDSTAQADSERALLVLASGKNGNYRLAGLNDALLVCVACGGVKEGVGLAIENGVLNVSETIGSREFTSRLWRFRLDPALGRLRLIGKDVVEGDAALGSGRKESVNYLTGRKIAERYRYDAARDREITLSSQKSAIPRQPAWLDELKEE